MTVAKRANLVESISIAPETCRLTFEMEDDLGFIGGQYIIINSGVTLPNGALAKRAYSIFSADDDQRRFQIAVRRIDSGFASLHLHSLKAGREIEFSGPWGKFLPVGIPSDNLVIATDTGITAALGLIRGKIFSPNLPRTRLLWFRESEEYFMDKEFVRNELPPALAEFHVFEIAPVGDPGRHDISHAFWIEQAATGAPERLYLAGDGDVIIPLKQHAIADGFPKESVIVECFFNNPARKAPSATRSLA